MQGQWGSSKGGGVLTRMVRFYVAKVVGFQQGWWGSNKGGEVLRSKGGGVLARVVGF